MRMFLEYAITGTQLACGLVVLACAWSLRRIGWYRALMGTIGFVGVSAGLSGIFALSRLGSIDFILVYRRPMFVMSWTAIAILCVTVVLRNKVLAHENDQREDEDVAA